MLSFIHVNRRVLDRSQLEVRGWLCCGVDELLEEEHRWLEECERFGPGSEEGVLSYLLRNGCRSFISDEMFPGQMSWWG